MAKNAPLSHSAPLISLSFKPYILLDFLPPFSLSVLPALLRWSVLLTVIIEILGEMLISEAYLRLRARVLVCVCTGCHILYLCTVLALKSIGGQNTLVHTSAGARVTNSC